MPSADNLIRLLKDKPARQLISDLYGKEKIEMNIARFDKLIVHYLDLFGDGDIQLFSTPGRTEIGGNHTDHNQGRVLAAAVNLDSIAAVTKTKQNLIHLFSESFTEPFIVDIAELQPRPEEYGTTTALIRGIAAKFKSLNFAIGGFNAYLTSNVLIGSGLSSSASIEVLLGTILNFLFNDGKIPAEQIAIIGQYAENNYFNKPCGLMDQMTCAVGGIVTIDFRNLSNPLVKQVNFDFDQTDYSLIVINSGGSHADLTEDYASIPKEMKAVALKLGGAVGRDVTYGTLISNIKSLRNQVGDRAILRMLHFLEDNERVVEQVAALEKNDFQKFLFLVNESGNSSNKWLQNSYTIKAPQEQGINLALAITENYIKKIKAGACRVHGGGFAGTVQVFLPNRVIHDYIELINSIFGEPASQILSIRSMGTIHLNSVLKHNFRRRKHGF